MLTLTDIFSIWHITRAAGLTAYLLLFLATTCGLMLSLQLTAIKYRSTILYFHKKSLYLLFLFTLLHGLILLFDKHVPFSLADIALPFWSGYSSWPLALGILAFYALMILSVTGMPNILKMLGHKRWRYLHYLSFPCYWLALFHGFTQGTDSSNYIILTLYVATGCIVSYLTFLRVWRSLKKILEQNIFCR